LYLNAGTRCLLMITEVGLRLAFYDLQGL
jgi:hypothetical protein